MSHEQSEPLFGREMGFGMRTLRHDAGGESSNRLIGNQIRLAIRTVREMIDRRHGGHSGLRR